jgi:hypothetical protein
MPASPTLRLRCGLHVIDFFLMFFFPLFFAVSQQSALALRGRCSRAPYSKHAPEALDV